MPQTIQANTYNGSSKSSATSYQLISSIFKSLISSTPIIILQQKIRGFSSSIRVRDYFDLPDAITYKCVANREVTRKHDKNLTAVTAFLTYTNPAPYSGPKKKMSLGHAKILHKEYSATETYALIPVNIPSSANIANRSSKVRAT